MSGYKQKLSAPGYKQVYGSLPGPTGTGTPGPAGGVDSVSSRSDLAAITSAGAPSKMVRMLSEAGREGVFVFDGSNLSAKVAADTAQGIYVAPSAASTGASGAWVRKFTGPVDPKWFGVLSTNTGAQNDAAILAMWATLAARATGTGSSRSLEAVRFTADGIYNFASTIDLMDGAVVFEGVAPPTDASGTTLKFPSGVTGIRVQRSDTTGFNLTRSPAFGADGSTIRNFLIDGAFNGTVEAEAHGVQLRAGAIIENVTISDFEGDGVYVSAAATAGSGADIPRGNANNFVLRYVRVIRCRNGVFIDGPDANASATYNTNLAANRQWGIWDSCFLGNSHYSPQAATCGITAYNDGVHIGASVVTYSGNRYFAIAGQEAGASTNAPSGTTADNTWWAYFTAGGTGTGIPTWTSGMLVRAGGSYHTDNINADHMFVTAYHEQGQAKPQIVYPTLFVGGNAAGSVYGTGAGMQVNVKSGINTLAAWHATNGNAISGLGERGANTILYYSNTSVDSGTYRLKQYTNNDFRWDYNNVSSSTAFYITGAGTANQFGTGAAFPHGFNPLALFVCDNGKVNSNSRRIMIDTAAPTTGAHGQGEWCFYRGTTAGLIGWKCTTAGTPGTWEAVYSGYSLGAIGYQTGAGGTVTQATSKTTGVTLSKLSGKITMNAASLAAGAAAGFTLTNTQIAASDVVMISIASGATADSYLAQVDAVAAGSCRISLRNMSAGALAEAVVLNFAVVRAASA